MTPLWLLPLVALALLLGGAGPAAAQALPEDPPEGSVEPQLEQVRNEEAIQPIDLTAVMFGADDDERRWSHYELDAEVRPLSIESVVLHQVRAAFAFGRWMIALSQRFLEWVLRFDLGGALADPAAKLARVYNTQVVGALGLRELALAAALARVAYLLLRDRATQGLAELVVAGVIAALGTAAIVHADRVACDGLDLLGGTTHAVLDLANDAAALDGPEPDFCGDTQPANPAADFATATFTTLVHDPYLLLQWGRVPPDGEANGCRAVADELVQRGVWIGTSFARDRLADAGCGDMAEFNQGVTADRTIGTLLFAVTATAFAVAVAMMAGVLLIAQVGGAVLVMTMPLALVAGVAPGAGRELLGRWFHAVLKVAVLFLGGALSLALLVTGVKAVAKGLPPDQPVAVRMLAVCAVAWGLVALRRTVFASLRRGAHGAARRAAGSSADVGPSGRAPGDVAVTAGASAVAGLATVHSLRAGAGAAAAPQHASGAAVVAAAGRAGQGPVGRGVAARLRQTAETPDHPPADGDEPAG